MPDTKHWYKQPIVHCFFLTQLAAREVQALHEGTLLCKLQETLSACIQLQDCHLHQRDTPRASASRPPASPPAHSDGEKLEAVRPQAMLPLAASLAANVTLNVCQHHGEHGSSQTCSLFSLRVRLHRMNTRAKLTYLADTCAKLHSQVPTEFPG